MQRMISFVVLGSLFLAACADDASLTGPEIPDPQFHTVVSGTPDGAYSQYFVDLELLGDFWVRVAQEWDASRESAECTTNSSESTHDGPDPLFPGIDEMLGAAGRGWFFLRTSQGWRYGTLRVERACWFDEWNPDGFPESTWIAGTAYVGLFGWAVPFKGKLVSNGFPAEDHLDGLDEAEFFLGGLGGVPVDGELHHEDGTSLFR
ncbi:MAG TPA: hypothetical protein VK849_06665 [Longimicrobiales bacterium]|nr:hypothetical protein [Longimicrobiales bacterium]